MLNGRVYHRPHPTVMSKLQWKLYARACLIWQENGEDHVALTWSQKKMSCPDKKKSKDARDDKLPLTLHKSLTSEGIIG